MSMPVGISGIFGSNGFFAPQAGALYAGMNFVNGSGTSTINTFLMSPVLTFDNGDTITFYTRTVNNPSSFPDRLRLVLSTNGASTAASDFSTILVSVNEGLTTVGYPNTWTQFTGTVSGLAGPTTGRFAFNYNVPNGGPSGNNSDYIGIDTVTLSSSVCASPTPTATATVTATPTATATPMLEELLVVDLTTTNQITITATNGLSAATVSGPTNTGFYFENFFANASPFNLVTTLVSGNLTAASVQTNNSPGLFRLNAFDPGLNVFSYTSITTTTFTAGQLAFTGTGTWTTPADGYAAMLTAPATGNVYFPADDVSDLPTATVLGTYRVILPGGPTATPTATATATPTATATATSTPTATATATPTATPGISGYVDYAVATRAVPDVMLDAPGSVPQMAVTDGMGNYAMSGFGAGPYTVTPSRMAEPCSPPVANGIMANDAAMIAMYVVGLITLTPDQVIAAKVSGALTPTLTSYDAGLIAQKTVGICNPNNLSGTWTFSPINISHPGGVNSPLTENYGAYLLGDVSGDWMPGGPAPARQASIFDHKCDDGIGSVDECIRPAQRWPSR